MKIAFWLIAMCVGITGVIGQTTTDSPYSFYGLGDENPKAFSYQRSLGSVGTAMFTPQYINTINPATYAGIRFPTFAVDMNWDFKTIESDLVTQETRRLYFNNLAIAFPLGRRAGMAASLRQYTKIGYNINVTETDPFLGNYQFQYDGQGGINQFSLGFAYSILADTNNTLSLGANMLYYFGFAETNRRTTNYEDVGDALSTNQKNRTSVNDFSFDIGLYYQRRFSRNFKVGFGASYSPNIKVKAKSSTLAYTYRPANGDEIVKDTVVFEDLNGFITLPSSLNLGIGLYIGKGWKLYADYRTQDWSQLEILGKNQNLNARSDLSFGVESQPNPDALAKFFQSIYYRAGFRYTNTRLKVRGVDITEYAASAGLGIPIMRNKSLSTLNFGIEFGQRGTKENGLVKENFTNLFLGVSFNPHKFDSWFKKSKYN
jgi:hypothetical protein